MSLDHSVRGCPIAIAISWLHHENHEIIMKNTIGAPFFTIRIHHVSPSNHIKPPCFHIFSIQIHQEGPQGLTGLVRTQGTQGTQGTWPRWKWWFFMGLNGICQLITQETLWFLHTKKTMERSTMLIDVNSNINHHWSNFSIATCRNLPAGVIHKIHREIWLVIRIDLIQNSMDLKGWYPLVN